MVLFISGQLIFNIRQHVTKQIIQTTIGRYFLNTGLENKEFNGSANLSVLILKTEQDHCLVNSKITGMFFMGKQVQDKKVLI